MKINTNTAALSALRNTGDRVNQLSQSIRQMASGKRLNSAADGPTEVLMTDTLRNQAAGLRQTKKSNEASASLLQVAEGNLAEVIRVLTEIRQIAIHAANEAVNDDTLLAADQLEIDHKIKAINDIASNTKYANINLLDGTMGVTGVTTGDNLAFISAGSYTPRSSVEGYPINIQQVATRTSLEGKVPLNVDNIGDGIFILVKEFETVDPFFGPEVPQGEESREALSQRKYTVLDSRIGKLKNEILQIQKNYKREPGKYTFDDMSREMRTLIKYHLNKEFERSRMNMEIFETPDQRFVIRHKGFGDGHAFSVVCNVKDVLTPEPMKAFEAREGLNVEGTISGYSAFGRGQYLTAREGYPGQGMKIRFDKELDYIEIPVFDEKGQRVGERYELQPQESLVGAPVEGYGHVFQDSKQFYLDSNQGFSMPFSFMNVRSSKIAQHVKNESGFTSLADVDVTSLQGARDSLKLIDKAISDVSEARADVGSFQRNTVEKTIRNVHQAADHIEGGASSVGDADIAQTMANLTRDQIMMMAGTSVQSHANKKPATVLALLGK